MTAAFLEPDFLREAGPAGFGRAIERMLLHWGLEDVSNIDGPGDAGADLIAHRGLDRWVFQCKWKKRGPVGPAAVDEVLNARRVYHAARVAVVTNTSFTGTARAAAENAATQGVRVDLLDGRDLLRFSAAKQFKKRLRPIELRPYQLDALSRLLHDLDAYRRALLVLATGLGKTVVAGEVVARLLSRNPGARILVIAHTEALVRQLERAFWWHLPSTVPSHVVVAGYRPDRLDGLACATIQSAASYVAAGYRPDFVFVDEAHHVGAMGQLAEILDSLDDVEQLGATATPWRGDRFDIQERFGDASYKLGIAEGMRLGYLADVRYRLFVDQIDWDVVRAASKYEYTMKDLNSKLFLPQRDERIRDELIGAWANTPDPRAIVFCRTVEHAEMMAHLLDRVPQFRGAQAVHADLKMRERQQRLLAFRSGEIPLLTAVDIMNEGVDVPDVNIICFARVTHSRRIFVQQLGRGLRLRRGKSHVEVLDFVSDIRRVAALMDLEGGLAGDSEELVLASQHKIEFNDAQVEGLMRAWIQDAASLETAADEARLDFPDVAELV